MSKPLVLEVFPPLSPLMRALVDMNVHPWQMEVVRLHIPGFSMAGDKRLTDAELAAEYHQQAAYTEYCMGRTTATHIATNQDRLETLRRFATTPHAGEPS
jgi:hypothetical protein